MCHKAHYNYAEGWGQKDGLYHSAGTSLSRNVQQSKSELLRAAREWAKGREDLGRRCNRVSRRDKVSVSDPRNSKTEKQTPEAHSISYPPSEAWPHNSV